MPILSIKNNPPSKTFEGSILEKDGTWWIAKVKPRQEKVFAFDLLEQGIDYYLPFYEKKTKRNDGKIRKSQLVLFPSYVPFIIENPFNLLRKDRVVTFLPIGIQQKFKKNLQFILLANQTSTLIEPVTDYEKYEEGNTVEIIDGCLTGATGKIVMYAIDKGTVILSIAYLGFAKVEIASCKCRKVIP